MDERYRDAARAHGGAISRLTAAVEADPARRAELTQEIHLQVWRSLAGFRGQCAERTWVLRVAHNVAASHVDAEHRRNRLRPIPLEGAAEAVDESDSSLELADRRRAVTEVHRLVRTLPTLDRQVVLLWLEGLTPAEIGEVVGASANAVTVRIHRAKAELTRRFRGGAR